MFGLDLDMASVRRDVDGFRTELAAIRKEVETSNALLARLVEIGEQK